MSRRVLHVLAQRPSHTGSGTTLQALVRHAAERDPDQHVIVGMPAGEPHPDIAGLPAQNVHPLVFGQGALDFALPGMSDVMPYASSRYRDLTDGQLERYRQAWRAHLQRVIERVRPALIHSHHVWIVSSLIKDVAGDLPVVTHCHMTGLRQMSLCPHLVDSVRRGVRRNERFLVLHEAQKQALIDALDVDPQRVVIVGAGYHESVFHARGRAGHPGESVLYAGKYSRAKGLPWLLSAVEGLRTQHPGLVLHVAGTGAGAEAEALRERMASMSAFVTMHGQVSQPVLADLMRRAAVFVLPSFYEGLPLVLVEAAASGCRVVATRLTGVERDLAPGLGDIAEWVPMPRLQSVDEPVAEDLPAFVEDLQGALARALQRAAVAERGDKVDLSAFTWNAVFERVVVVYQQLGHVSRQ